MRSRIVTKVLELRQTTTGRMQGENDRWYVINLICNRVIVPVRNDYHNKLNLLLWWNAKWIIWELECVNTYANKPSDGLYYANQLNQNVTLKSAIIYIVLSLGSHYKRVMNDEQLVPQYIFVCIAQFDWNQQRISLTICWIKKSPKVL